MINFISEPIIYITSGGLSVFTLTLFLYSLYKDYILAKKRQKDFFQGKSPSKSPFLKLLRPFASFIGHIIRGINKI